MKKLICFVFYVNVLGFCPGISRTGSTIALEPFGNVWHLHPGLPL